MKKTNLAIVIVLLIVASSLLFALQMWMSARQSTVQEISGTELFPGEKELYSKAKLEGALIVYTVWDAGDIAATLKAFSKRYPGIKTEDWEARNPEIVARVLTEFQAGQQSVDTVLSDSAPPVLRAAGAVTPYETVQKEFLLLHDPTMPVVGLQIQVLAYNTNKLKPEDLPATWEDLTNPRYKGTVALDDPLRAGPLSHMLAALKSYWGNDTRWVDFIKGLKSLDSPTYGSSSEMLSLLVAGEYSMAMPALLHDVLNEKGKGAPVDFIKTAPPIIFPRFAAIYARAPHPNSARLFAEWLISPEGQGVLDSVGRETVRKGFASHTSVDVVFPKDIDIIPVNDQNYLANPKAWLDQYVKPIWQSA
jgi:iron(III) transport system substrate-binding protein